MNYTQPVSATFELQRQTIAQSQKALQQTLEVQQRFAGAAIDSLDTQEMSQRRAVELQQNLVHNALDAFEENVPGAETATEDMRVAFDDQVEMLLENHEEFFGNVSDELENGVGSYDEMTAEYVDALEEQVNMLLEAHEDLEVQSVDAVEQFTEQFEELQEQAEDIQSQIQDVSEQAAQAVEA